MALRKRSCRRWIFVIAVTRASMSCSEPTRRRELVVALPTQAARTWNQL